MTFMDNINWKLLTKQKLWLIGQSGTESDGLLSLIDALQDAAVKHEIASPRQVFGDEDATLLEELSD